MSQTQQSKQPSVHLAAPVSEPMPQPAAAGDRACASAVSEGTPCPVLADDFQGDTPHLIRCIEALLALDAQGAILPSSRGIGGHARTLLSAAASRLAAGAADAAIGGLPTMRAENGYRNHLERAMELADYHAWTQSSKRHRSRAVLEEYLRAHLQPLQCEGRGAPTGQSRPSEARAATLASSGPDEQDTASAMAQDAFRYRWLRDRIDPREVKETFAFRGYNVQESISNQVDAAIDAALRAVPQQPTGERE